MPEVQTPKPEFAPNFSEGLVKVVISSAAGYLTSKLVEKGMDAFFEYRRTKAAV